MVKATNTEALKKQQGKTGGWGILNRIKSKIVREYAGSAVLDVGCGNGSYVYYLNKLGYEAQGCDLLTDKAWSRNKNFFKVADIYNLPYDNNSFDTLILFEILEHLEDTDEAFDEIKRVTRKNIIVSVPNCDLPIAFFKSGLLYYHYFDRTHVNFFTQDTIKELLIKNGFWINYVRKINPVMPITFLLHSFYVPLQLATVIGKIFQRIPFGRKYYTDILIVGSKIQNITR